MNASGGSGALEEALKAAPEGEEEGKEEGGEEGCEWSGAESGIGTIGAEKVYTP